MIAIMSAICGARASSRIRRLRQRGGVGPMQAIRKEGFPWLTTHRHQAEHDSGRNHDIVGHFHVGVDRGRLGRSSVTHQQVWHGHLGKLCDGRGPARVRGPELQRHHVLLGLGNCLDCLDCGCDCGCLGCLSNRLRLTNRPCLLRRLHQSKCWNSVHVVRMLECRKCAEPRSRSLSNHAAIVTSHHVIVFNGITIPARSTGSH